jgi:hypothetical protein
MVLSMGVSCIWVVQSFSKSNLMYSSSRTSCYLSWQGVGDGAALIRAASFGNAAPRLAQ